MTEEKSIEEELSYPILLGERVRKAIEDADSSKQECAEVGKHVDRLTQMLRSAVRIATSNPCLYERPIRCIVADAVKGLERAITLVRKCKRGGILRRVVNITNATDFRKVFSLLEASVGDTKWLLNVLSGEEGIVITLPPIANTDPILSYVWSNVAVVLMGGLSVDRVEAANNLASLALDNDRNKKIILEEGGVPPLLKLLKEGASPEAQVAAAIALSNLATDRARVSQIADQLAVPIIVKVLYDSPMRVQIQIALLVSKMAGLDPDAQEDFGRENVIRPLVSLLSFETFSDDPKPSSNSKSNSPNSIHSLIQSLPPRKPTSNSSHHPNYHSSEGSSSRGHGHRKEREDESPEVKLKLKISSAEALRMLSRDSIANSRRITETKGLLCLAKIIEKESGELQLNCLMTVMEIAAAAESNSDLRRSAFKTSSPAAKAVVDQLLRVMREEGSSSDPTLLIPAIQSIGSLARTFPVRETRVITLLVTQLGHRNLEVAAEAAVALGKFACPDNFNCIEHSKAIIESDGVPPLMRLLRSPTERAQLYGLILLCYLALHVGNSEALERAKALTALELAGRSLAAQDLSLKELLPRAMYQLELYQAGVHPHRHSNYIP